MKWIRSAASILLLFSLFPSMPTASAAYAFTTHTFTTCTATGTTGPTQSQCTSSYATTWDDNTSNFTVTNGIQLWTVPGTGKYSITAAGAKGGNGVGTLYGGKGSVITGTFTLTEGTKLRILVGQSGTDNTSYNGGGGGGSWVMKETDNTTGGIYVIAGGGGGGAQTVNGSNINAVTTSTAQPGWNGTANSNLNNAVTGGNGGANSDRSGGGGGGLTGDGGSSTYTSCSAGWWGLGGKSFVNGGAGGAGAFAGGFGGGGSGDWCYYTGGGGGGGYSGGGGGYYWGSGGGGGSYNNGTDQSNSGGLNNAAGYVTITSLGPSITTFAPRTTLTNSSSITYDLVFSEAVTGLVAADFTKSGTGSSSCTIGTPSGSGTTYSITLSGCSPGTAILTLAANSVTNAVPQTAPTSNTDAATVVIDQTAPSFSSVTAPANKTYKPSETPTFTVNFSESVTVTGTPRLTLTVGSLTKYANFVSLTDSKTALFRYTVATAADEFDTDGIAVSTTLDLNGGTIADLATNALSPLTFTAPTLTSVLVAQPPSAPTITGITATSGQLSVAFNAGASNGSAITNFQYSTNNGGAWTTRSPVATTSPIVISGLTDGTAYTVRIRAINAAGNGDSSTAVTETPTAVAVTGDATLVLTYGNSASTGAYSASGGTNTFTWSLGSVLTGISLSATTVTASASTPAGTYTQSVRATDGNSQVGTKTLTITVNKATTSITIALPNSATDAALGGAITITATVPRAGAVNFKLGGTTISGCGSAAAASTTASCSWTPGALGSVSLTAVFTPTDSLNYETATTTTLTINVVNGVSTVSLSLTGGVTQTPKGQAINIIAAIDQAGKVSFFVDGKRIAKCFNLNASAGNKTCSWVPATQKQVTITVTLDPTNAAYDNSSSALKVWVLRRSGLR